MTEQQESGPDVVNQELPTPKFTEHSGDSSNSTLDLDTLAEKVAEKLRPNIEKSVQSVKDKRLSKVDKMERFLGLDLTELEELGATIPEQAKLELRLRQLEQKRQSEPSPAVVEMKAEDWSTIIEKVGLDTKQPDIINFLRGEFRNLDDFELKARRLSDSLRQPETTPAQKSTMQGNTPATVDVASKINRLSELQKFPSRNLKEINALEKELEAVNWGS